MSNCALQLLRSEKPNIAFALLCHASLRLCFDRQCVTLPCRCMAVFDLASALLCFAFALIGHASLRHCCTVCRPATARPCVALPYDAIAVRYFTLPLLCRDMPGSTKPCAAFALLCGTSPCCRRALHSRCFAEHSSTVLLPRPTKLRFTTPLLCDTYTTSHRFALLLLCHALPSSA